MMLRKYFSNMAEAIRYKVEDWKIEIPCDKISLSLSHCKNMAHGFFAGVAVPDEI